MEKKTKGHKHPVSIMIRGIYRPDGDYEQMAAEVLTEGFMSRLMGHCLGT